MVLLRRQDPKDLHIYGESFEEGKKPADKKRIVYFDVDTDVFPYKRVRGKAQARVLPKGDKGRIAFVKKILSRYVDPKTKVTSDYLRVRRGESIVIELTPTTYFSA